MVPAWVYFVSAADVNWRHFYLDNLEHLFLSLPYPISEHLLVVPKNISLVGDSVRDFLCTFIMPS